MNRILTISAGRTAPLLFEARGARESVASGIVKRPVSTLDDPLAVAVSPMGIDGDEQADLTVHGGLGQAVYVYPAEHYPFWHTVRSQAKVAGDLPHGSMGENLTVEGLLETGVWLGDQIEAGEVVLRVERHRKPCYKFDAHMGFSWATRMMVQSGYCGFYCSVVRPGKLAAGTALALRAGDRNVNIAEMHRLAHRGPTGRR